MNMFVRRALGMALTLYSCSFFSWAQIAQWKIPPRYDEMYIPANTQLVKTDSAGVQTGLWTFDGKQLVRTDGDIHPFRDGFAVSTDRGTVAFRGFYTDIGSFIPVKGGPYHVAREFPYQVSGFILVQAPANHFFHFVNLKGDVSQRSFVDAYPFFNGYAACQYYGNPEKQRDVYYGLLQSGMNPVTFTVNGKSVAPSDIDFISSVNDEGIAVVIVKKKVYLYHAGDSALQPIGPTLDSSNPKEQAKLVTDFVQAFVLTEDSQWQFSARCEKNEFITFFFDEMMLPVLIKFTDKEMAFVKTVVQPGSLSSPLRVTVEGDKYGLVQDGQELLPPQFDDFPSCFEENAIVKLSGKYGLLFVHKDDMFQLSMFKGKDIPFKHQTFETNIRLDLPTYILAENTSMEVDPSSGCDIDKKSAEIRNTQFGNYVQYDCVLHIPDYLRDDPTEVRYPTTVYYNGLRSSLIPFTVKAWHYKYFVVDILDTEKVLDKGTLSFTFNINAGLEYGAEAFRREVSVGTDSLSVNLDKISETRYKCHVVNLQEGLNSIVVHVVEQGCPPVDFPFDIIYTKPVAATKGKPGTEESVVIKKKERKTNQPDLEDIPFIEM